MKNRNNEDMEKCVGKSIKWASASFLCSTLTLATVLMTVNSEKEITKVETVKEFVEKPIIITVNEPEMEEITDIVEPETVVSINGLEYLQKCVEAEAGNQDAIGKAFVCDVVLNRLDLPGYETVYDVINEDGQFDCVSNGSINKVSVTQETIDVVDKEVLNRINSEILYFRTKRYHKGTEPCFKYQDHYFSK